MCRHLVSRGPTQQAIKAACDDLGIKLISYSPLGLGLLTGKYDASQNNLPSGPRGLLFRQILPGLQPLIEEMRKIATARRKTVPQVCQSVLSALLFLPQVSRNILFFEVCASGNHVLKES